MQSSIFTKSHEFNPTIENMTFHEVDWGKGNSGWGSVNFRYYLNPLHIQTPKLTTPFGYSEGNPNYSNKDYNCQFNLDPKTEKIQAFQNGLRQFEQTLIRTAWENRVAWNLFGNQTEANNATLNDVKAKFSPIVRESRNGEYPPTLKLAFDTRYNKETADRSIKTECHDSKNQEITPSTETIPRRSQCILQIKANSIWISPDRKFGVKFAIERIKVYPPEERPGAEAGFGSGLPSGTGCLLDSDSED